MNDLSGGEELSTGKLRSMVYKETSIAEQRGQLEEVISPSPSPMPTPEKRSEQDLEEVSMKSLVQEKSNEWKI